MDWAAFLCVECGLGAGLADETVEGLLVLGHFFGDEFEGKVAGEAGIFGLVDYTHAATTEFSDDAVVGDCLADHARGLKEPSALMSGCGAGSGQLRARVIRIEGKMLHMGVGDCAASIPCEITPKKGGSNSCKM